MRAWGLALAFLVTTAGCGPFAGLSLREQEPFQNCRDYMLASICGRPGQHCMNERNAADDYAALAPASRPAWLFRRGCPGTIAGYSEPRIGVPQRNVPQTAQLVTPSGFEDAPAPEPRASFEEHHDEFNGAVSIRYRARFSFDQTHNGHRRNGGFTVVYYPDRAEAHLTITAGSDRWRYLRCSAIDLLVDGAPVPVEDEEHHGEVRRGGVIEAVVGTMDVESLRRLASASTVRARVCSDTFNLRTDDIPALRGFVERLPAPEWTPPSPPSP
jgi:hypothetical protein